MTNAACKNSYGSKITNQMMCAAVDGGGKDSCQVFYQYAPRGLLLHVWIQDYCTDDVCSCRWRR